MRELLFRIIRRAIPVAITLAILGFLLGKAYLIAGQMLHALPNPDNEAVLWKTPLKMAGFGVAVLVVIEVVAFAIRRKRPPTPLDPDFEPDKPVSTK